MLLRTLGRLLVVPLAFVLAGAAAAAVLLTIGLERVTHVAATRKGDISWLGDIWEMARHGRNLASVASLAPAVLLVIVGEVLRVRSWLFYMLGGGATLAAIPFMARVGQSGMAAVLDGGIWQVFATAGFAGGIVYWALAGRTA